MVFEDELASANVVNQEKIEFVGWTKSLQDCVLTSTQLENEIKVTQNELNVAKPLVTKVIAYIIA